MGNIDVDVCTHWRVDVLSTERHPGGDRVVGAWVSLCDADDRSLGAVELTKAEGMPVYGSLFAELGRLAEAATVDWPVKGAWTLPVDDGVQRFVDHRCTPDGRSFEVLAESVRFPLADVADSPNRVPVASAA